MPVALHDRIREIAAEATSALDALTELAWRSSDAATLELCRLRIAAMLGDDAGAQRRTQLTEPPSADKVAALATWWVSPLFNCSERARLGFTEQFVLSVASMTDTDVDALLAGSDEREVYQFVAAIYVLDVTTRASIVTNAIFGDTNGTA